MFDIISEKVSNVSSPCIMLNMLDNVCGTSGTQCLQQLQSDGFDGDFAPGLQRQVISLKRTDWQKLFAIKLPGTEF